jgi:hypothetical protein
MHRRAEEVSIIRRCHHKQDADGPTVLSGVLALGGTRVAGFQLEVLVPLWNDICWGSRFDVQYTQTLEREYHASYHIITTISAATTRHTVVLVMIVVQQFIASICSSLRKNTDPVVSTNEQNLCKAIWRIRVIGESVKQKAAGD